MLFVFMVTAPQIGWNSNDCEPIIGKIQAGVIRRIASLYLSFRTMSVGTIAKRAEMGRM
jgi:hypothetical protein